MREHSSEQSEQSSSPQSSSAELAGPALRQPMGLVRIGPSRFFDDAVVRAARSAA